MKRTAQSEGRRSTHVNMRAALGRDCHKRVPAVNNGLNWSGDSITAIQAHFEIPHASLVGRPDDGRGDI